MIYINTSFAVRRRIIYIGCYRLVSLINLLLEIYHIWCVMKTEAEFFAILCTDVCDFLLKTKMLLRHGCNNYRNRCVSKHSNYHQHLNQRYCGSYEESYRQNFRHTFKNSISQRSISLITNALEYFSGSTNSL